MARDIQNRTNVKAPDAVDPYGKVLDETAKGANDGTPMNEELFNDIAVFFQKLLDEAGVAPNELPENLTNGFQLYEALLKVAGGGADGSNGGGGGDNADIVQDIPAPDALAIGTAYYLVAMSPTRIAVADNNTQDLIAYDFDGTQFTQVGAALAIGGLAGPRMAALSSSRIVITNDANGEMKTYDFNGANWSQAGNTFVLPGNRGLGGVTALSGSRIVGRTIGGGDWRVYDFDGADWAQVGNTFAPPSAEAGGFAAFTGSTFAVSFDVSNEIRAYQFDGTNISQVGNTLGIVLSVSNIIAMAIDKIVLANTTGTLISQYKWDGTDFILVGATLTVVGMGGPVMSAFGQNRFIFADTGLNTVNVYKLVANGPPTPLF